MLALFTLLGYGQFEYFNIVQETPALSTNIEVFDDHYYVLGTRVVNGANCEYIRKYDLQGEQVDENCIFFPDEFHFIGETNSFKRVPEQDKFFFAQVKHIGAGILEGFAMMVDSDLDTLWTRSYDTYSPETYFYAHTWDGDGFIIAGEHGPEAGERGTFIMKLDTLGNVLWHEMIHQPEEGVFRNRDISVVEGGYVWSGTSGTGSDTEGNIEFIDNNLELQFSTQDQGGLRRLWVRHTYTDEGNVIAAQTIGTQDYPPLSDPLWVYTTLRIFELTTGSGQLTLLTELLEEEDHLIGQTRKIIEVSDGFVVLGGAFDNSFTSLPYYSWLLKINESYEQEWYSELAYNESATTDNLLYDLEQAPDGGYVMVGEFTDTSIDPNPRTWLVKVDACGDLEWQGCDPVGLGEWEAQSNFNIYPNPTVDELNIESKSNEEWDEICITDILGQELQREKNTYSTINVGDLGTGIYVLTLYSKGLPIHSVKFMKE